jgi:hypothetical protein
MAPRSFAPAALRLALPVLALPLAGCPDDDAAVFVEASISSPAATVEQETLGTVLGGGFDLALHLGPRASGPSQVSVGAFALQNADQSLTLVPTLSLATTPSLPVEVGIDSDVLVGVTFGTGDGLLPVATYDEICAAGELVISGAVQDSLQDGSTPVVSSPFLPDGC